VNDDGIKAEGLYVLAKELEKDYELTIIAPDNQKSAQSHAITLTQPLRVREVKLDGLRSKAYSVSGTPADCVRLGLEVLAGDKVDMIISGINIGLNVGMDILYSGTVSAAIEANIYQLPSIAISAEEIAGRAKFEIAARSVKEILEKSLEQIKESGIVLNINVPYRESEEIKGIKTCKIGGPIYDYYIMEDGENGENIIKLNGRKDGQREDGTDRHYIREGYITVTPLHYDLTNFQLLNEIKAWI